MPRREHFDTGTTEQEPQQLQLFATPPDDGPVVSTHTDPLLEEHRRFSAEAPMEIRTAASRVGNILEEGYKTQHDPDVDHSAGYYNPEFRAQHEDKLFGEGARPTYGYFSHGDVRDSGLGYNARDQGAVDWYGNTALRLKENVRSDTTYTPGDSLGTVPNQVARPGEDVGETPFSRSSGYTEMQVHRPVEAEDIASVNIHVRHPSEMDLPDIQGARETLRNAGMPHEVRQVGEYKQEPLAFDDMGSAGESETKRWYQSDTIAKWSPEKGEHPAGKGGVVNPGQFGQVAKEDVVAAGEWG